MSSTLADGTPVNLRATIAAVLVTAEQGWIHRGALREHFPYGNCVGGEGRDPVTLRIKMCLKRFDRDGWIRRDGDRIYILDRGQLLRVAVTLLSPTSPAG